MEHSRSLGSRVFVMRPLAVLVALIMIMQTHGFGLASSASVVFRPCQRGGPSTNVHKERRGGRAQEQGQAERERMRSRRSTRMTAGGWLIGTEKLEVVVGGVQDGSGTRGMLAGGGAAPPRLALDVSEADAGNKPFTTAIALLVDKDAAGAKKALSEAEAAWKESGKVSRTNAAASSPYPQAVANVTQLLARGSISSEQGREQRESLARELLKAAEACVQFTTPRYNKAPGAWEKGGMLADLKQRETLVLDAAKYLMEGEQWFAETELIKVPEERGWLRNIRAQVKFYLNKHRFEAGTSRDSSWWATRRMQRAEQREEVAAQAEDLRFDCKPAEGGGLAFEKEIGDQAYMEAEDAVAAGEWDKAREALKQTAAAWETAGMLGFPGRPFEAAIEMLLDKCDAAQGVKSPRVGESGSVNKVVAGAAASASLYARNKRPWDL